MYCRLCGQDGPGDGVACTYCGEPFHSTEIVLEDESDATQKAPTEDPAPRQSLPVSTLLIPGILFVLTVICIVIFCMGKLNVSIGNIFVSPSALMEKVYCRQIEKTFDLAETNDYIPYENAMAVRYQADIHVSQDVLSFAADAWEVNREDITGLSNIQINSDVAYDRNLLNAVYELNLSDESILSVEQWLDHASQQQYIKIPQLSDELLLTDWNGNTAPSSLVAQNPYAAVSVDPQLLEEILIYYTKMLISDIENVNRSKQKVTVGTLSQKLVVLQATISNQQLCYTLISMLEDASQNPNVAVMIRDIEIQTGKTYYTEFIKALEQEISEIKNYLLHSDAYEDFTIYTYLNRRQEIVGVKLEYTHEGNIFSIGSGIALAKGRQFAIDISIFDSFSLEGEGTVGDEMNGTFSLIDSEQDICDIKLTDICYKKGNISGSIFVIPAEQIVENIVDSMGLYQSYLNAGRLQNFSIEIILDWTPNYQKTVLNSFTQKSALMSIELLAERKADVPALDDKFSNIQALDGEAWHNTIDKDAVDSLIERLHKAGIDKKILDYASESE